MLSVFILSCSDKKNNTETAPLQNIEKTEQSAKKPLGIEIYRLEQDIFNAKSKLEIKKILDKHLYFSEKFLKRSQYPHDSILVNAFYELAVNPSMDSIFQITQDVFGDLYDLGSQLEAAFEEIKKVDPKFRAPKVYTVMTGMGNDMFVNDSIVVIGLEFFLAENCKYKPQLPLYMLKRYRKEYIVPMIIAIISGKYNETDYLDNTLAAEMIYFGKSYYFMEKILGNVPDSLIAGYEQSVLDDVKKNNKIIWAHFIEKNLLYETKNEVTNRYVGERPITYEIGNKCPGRIGRWLGWQIVRSYAEKTDVSLMEVMKEKDAKKILSKSKYKPG